MADFFAPEYENCICIIAGDDKAMLITNLNCDGSRIKDISAANGSFEWAIADSSGAIVASNIFTLALDSDYVTFVIPNSVTSVLGGRYNYHVRFTDTIGLVTTYACGCLFIKKCALS